MFLKSLELNGFKSFADKTRMEFASGTTSLLGPNGCGKSNIVDAIKWVLGEQSTKTLRAGKMEDVIFNGTESRKAMNYAEVTLVISNEKEILPVESTEVEIKRRLFRSGESEFFINRNQVRLRDIRELFFDTGVGKSAYSILEQGKIDQILSHKPEDRRYIFEEAAGITRYKARSVEAQRKLERTEENIEQVETLLQEIKRQYESRKGQVARLNRYKELEDQQASLEVDVQFGTIRSYQLLLEQKENQLVHTQKEFSEIQQEIENIKTDLEEKEFSLSDQVEKRIEIQSRINTVREQIRGKDEQLDLLKQHYKEYHERKIESQKRSLEIAKRLEQNLRELENKKSYLITIDSLINEKKHDIAATQATIDKTLNEIAKWENEIIQAEISQVKEEESQQQLSLNLQEIADKMATELDKNIKESGYSIELKNKNYKIMLDALNDLLIKIREFKENQRELLVKEAVNLKTLIVKYNDSLPNFIDELMGPGGILTEKHSIDKQLHEGRQKITTIRNTISKLRNNIVDSNDVLETNRSTLTNLKIELGESVAQQDLTKILIESLERQRFEQSNFLLDADKESQNSSIRVKESLNQIKGIENEKEDLIQEGKDLEQQLALTIREIEDSNINLGSQKNRLNTLYTKQSEVRSSIDKYTFHIESLNEQIQSVYRNFFESYGKSLKEYDERLDAEIEDVTSLREKLSHLKKQILNLGYINHMAIEEFNEIKERHDFLSHQINDLEKAKGDLTKVIEEIKKRSEELFIDSFNKIRASFQQMFHRMFGGGRADLRLIDPENLLESGIDILAQPPGKKLDRLDPLSGGEKSLTAVALLFATYKVKPSPFCVLDEIDASLDDRNIGYFLTVLDEFSQTSQFIIITHNKHTVMGSSTLLGVTMEEKGVSKAISYKMGFDSERDEVIYGEQLDIALNNTV